MQNAGARFRSAEWLAAGAVVLAVALAAAAAAPPDAAVPRGTLDEWVLDLGSPDYRLRVAATRRLRDCVHAETIAAVIDSAAWSDPEVAARCLRVLKHHAEGDDERVRRSAQAALEQLLHSSDVRLAARAGRLLADARLRLVRLVEGAGGTVEFADVKGERIAGIHLQRCPQAAELLGRLKGIDSLERLNLASCGIADQPLERLPELVTLKYLCLQSNPMTDAGLKHVAKLGHLEALYLSSTQITDEGVEHLRRLDRLKVLWLNYTQIGDDAVDVLAGLKHLKHLRLTGTRVTDTGLERLAAALPETRITR